MAEEIVDFGLANDEYWTNPFKSRVQLEGRLLGARKEVLVIGAPAAVPVQDRQTLPVAVLRTATLENMAKVDFIRYAQLTAIDLSHDKVYVYPAVVLDMEPPPPYDGPPETGMGGEAFLIDARRQLGLPWAAGTTFLIHLIMRDRISNRVRVELKKGGYEDSAAIEFLRRREKLPQPLEIWPPPAPPMTDPFEKPVVTIPDYRDRSDSPPIPAQEGIALNVDRVIEVRHPLSCIVRGSFRVPAQPRHVVRRSPTSENLEAVPHTAVIPITLLVTGSDSVTPHLFELGIPTYDPIDANGGVATGYFTLDLCSLKDFVRMDETFFVYAYCGEILMGPTPVAFVH